MKEAIKLLTNISDWTPAFIESITDKSIHAGLESLRLEAKKALDELLIHAAKIEQARELLGGIKVYSFVGDMAGRTEKENKEDFVRIYEWSKRALSLLSDEKPNGKIICKYVN